MPSPALTFQHKIASSELIKSETIRIDELRNNRRHFGAPRAVTLHR